MSDESETLDAEKHVVTYRKVMAQLEAQTTPEGKDEFERIAMLLRKEWKDWEGEDALHEMAFGEPEE